MLLIEPRRRRGAGGCKLAIALAGGGPLGAFYEMGALHALSEAIGGRELTAFDVYVGVSSGSLVAAGLANGFDTTALGRIYINDESTLYPFSPATLLHPAFGEYARRLAQLPAVLANIARQYAQDPLANGWPAGLGSLSRLVPTAVFDQEPLLRHLRAVFNSEGHTDDFRKLRSRLYVVATNLNTGESVNFGGPDCDRVPISRALLASCALPGLYRAVEIDGEYFVDGALVRTMHASLALEEGCDLVICINPLVPFEAPHPRPPGSVNLAAEGLPVILGQTFRSLIYSRMKIGMAAYGARFPTADIVLLEPDRHDERLFFANVFRYSERRRLANHAYQRTRHDLLMQADKLAPVLERRGLHLNMKVLRDRRRSFSSAARERSSHARQTAQRLDHALERLERMLAMRASG
ncbi:MAG TPA: patatin-like phospholipase family protein [Steroidobacteraceae bacterium]|nr:patatin-like phospholipase family protein [Steroidobacteraceae bacterium]